MRPLVLICVSLSLILCLLSITTDYWYENIENEYNSGLFIKCSRLSFNNLTSKMCIRLSYIHSSGIAISALIFLSISFIVLIISWFKSEDRFLAYLTVLCLLISLLLLIFAYILYPKEKDYHQIGHSTYLMVISSFLTFLSTILTAFIAHTM